MTSKAARLLETLMSVIGTFESTGNFRLDFELNSRLLALLSHSDTYYLAGKLIPATLSFLAPSQRTPQKFISPSVETLYKVSVYKCVDIWHFISCVKRQRIAPNHKKWLCIMATASPRREYNNSHIANQFFI